MSTGYADQRGHDVTWMTAAEREALTRLEKATGGPVTVLDVTSEPVMPDAAPAKASLHMQREVERVIVGWCADETEGH